MAGGQDVQVIFTPHLVPMDRGILTHRLFAPRAASARSKCWKSLRRVLRQAAVRRASSDRLPGTKDVSGTNYCDITARVVRGRVMTISCLDNLIKGRVGASRAEFQFDVRTHAETTGAVS